MVKEKIVLAYSGGLDTSVAIKWLQDKYHYDVIAVAADLGEGKNLQAIKEKALNIGAVQAHILYFQGTLRVQHHQKRFSSNKHLTQTKVLLVVDNAIF